MFSFSKVVFGQQDQEQNQSIDYFNLQDIRLLPSPFSHAQDLDLQYLLALDPDRLLAPFLRESGLQPKADPYTNWENTGLDGHIGGHYLSALSLMYASTQNIEIKGRLEYYLSELRRAQTANGNGYLGGVPEGKKIWSEIASGKIDAGAFSLNNKWVPLYNIHKTFAGLRDAYIFAGSSLAKAMLTDMCDWMKEVVSGLDVDQIQDMLRSEHGGLNETFADVAEITGELKYLELAKKFSHKLILDPLINQEDKLTGLHANTQIPKVIGLEKIAQLEGNEKWSAGAAFFWKEIVHDRSVSIGGNSAFEHFHPKDDFSRMIHGTQGPETCNTYNMLRLTRLLNQRSVDSEYVDYYERALYNHILSSQHPETGGLVYFTQMRPGHYRVYSQPQTSFWCCVGSGIENHAKYGEMIYAHNDNALYVNLFIPSSVRWVEKKVQIFQINNFPYEPSTRLIVSTLGRSTFDIKIRKPDWLAEEDITIKINGQKTSYTLDEDGFFVLSGNWQNQDEIFVELPMELKAERLPDGSDYYAFKYGPVVLAAKTGSEDLDGLFADDSRGGHIAGGKIVPMKDIPIMVSNPNEILNNIKPVPDKSLHFTLTGLHSGSSDISLELLPFYELHESRYIIYFPQATKEGLRKIQQKIEADEAASEKLNSITIDLVLSGAQQSESDHFIEQTGTWNGYIYENLYREGSGKFQYKLTNKQLAARYLMVKYFDIDANRKCRISIGKDQVGALNLNGKSSEKLNSLVVLIPEKYLNEETIKVSVEAIDNAWMTKIVEVRLLSKMAE